MKLPISWLKEYVDLEGISAEDLADKLTMSGQEIESVETDIIFSGVVIGEVVERIKHPNADKLNVAKVRIKPKDIRQNTKEAIIQIVCGAPNLNVGQKVPVALVGAKLGDFEIQKVELRGVTSHGMICSEKELGLGEDHKGIMVLDKKAEVGADFGEYLGTEKVLDVKVMANKPDCMGIVGLARETAATLGKKLAVKEAKVRETVLIETKNLVAVDIKDKELCTRYVCRVVMDVTNQPSPKWLVERLKSMGARSINLLVDLSNYIMFETGQPLHFFDLDKIKENDKAKIIVRRAGKGEEIVTLDGVKRKLTDEMLVIADSKKAIALAGVMGGENTEVDENTKNILIEAAVFNKASIRRTSRSLGLRSEAVARFEKGITHGLPRKAIDRAAELLVELAGGKVTKGVVDASTVASKSLVLKLDLERLNSFLGVVVPRKEVMEIFDRLGFESKSESGNSLLSLTVPWWRSDIRLEADLYEEVARFWGYDKIPATLPKTILPTIRENKKFETDQEIRERLSSIGLDEILTYSFIGGKELLAVNEDIQVAPKVANPLVAEQELMRTSLIPHMLTALSENQFLRDEVRFFEIAKTFELVKGQKLPKEKKWLAIGMIGGKSWPIEYKEGNNFYDLKGIISHLLGAFWLRDEVMISDANDKRFIVGQSAGLFLGETELGVFGEIEKQILKNFNLKKQTGIALIDLDVFYGKVGKERHFHDFSKFPKIVRDLSIVIKETVNVGDLVASVDGSADLLVDLDVVDIYQGKPLEKDEKNVTLRFEFQSPDRTLTVEEIDKIIKEIEKKIIKFGGEIRK